VVTGIVDPDTKRAQETLDIRKREKRYETIYSSTKIYTSMEELWKEQERPDCVFIGLPPECHGSTRSPNDVELQCAKAGVHMFIEKPLSCHPLEETKSVSEALKHAKTKDGKQILISIGYMLRYSNGVKKMQELIAKNNWKVVSTIARYNCAYASILKQAWWDDRRSGGPIIEQATHFCDLSRLLAGEVDISSVNALSVSATSPLGNLQNISPTVSEDTIPVSHRIPRTTAAFWKYTSGALGSLNHGLLLQGTKYSSEYELWGDGFRMVIVDPYHNCKLYLRTADSEEEQFIPIDPADDMYYNELKAFIDAVRGVGSTTAILSSYEDAVKSYELTWAIRLSSEAKLSK